MPALPAGDRPAAGEQGRAAEQADRRQQEGGLPAVPERQLLGALGATSGSVVGVRGHQRLEQRAGHAEHQPAQRQDGGRGQEQRRRRVHELGGRGVGQPGLAGEGAPPEAQRVARRSAPSPPRARRGRRPRPSGRRRPPSSSAANAASLPTKPSSGGTPAIESAARPPMTASAGSRRPSPDSCRRSRVPVAWSMTPTVRKSVDLNSACAMVIDQPGRGELLAAGADEHHEEAELADRAEREQQLQVGLAERAVAADEHRRRAEAEHDRPPAGHVGEPGREAGDQVDAGLHHRRGVQVRADRGGRLHRGGQPEVERHQRRLGDRADEEQHGARRPSPSRCPGRRPPPTAGSCRWPGRPAGSRRASPARRRW